MPKVFSKRAWLESANAKKEKGILTEREINTAYTTWVEELDGKTKEELDGKTKEELDAMGKNTYNDAYFVDA